MKSRVQVGSWRSDLHSEADAGSHDNHPAFGMSAEAHEAHEAFLDRVHPDDRVAVRSAFEASVARRLPYVIDHRLLLPDGSLKWVQQRWEITYDESGAVVSASGTTDDITERMSAMQSLQKSDERFQLAANMAHEFNNVLMGIQPFVEVIRRLTLDIPKVQSATERIAKSVQRGKDITDEILRLKGRVEPVPQSAEVGQWLLDLASEAGPAAGETVRNASRSKRADLQRPPKMILIVDDEPAVVDGISMLLASEGLPSASVSEGAEVVAAIKQHTPELVLLDIGLRDVSGIEVFKEIRAQWPDLPVVLMTGHYSRSSLGSILELPGVRFLQKPFGADELLQALETTPR